MTHARRARRGGFTLIELLAVIAILGVLSAIAVGGYFRIRSSQEVKANEDTLKKYTSMLQQQYTATLANAEKEFASGTLPGAEPLDQTTKVLTNQFASLLIIAGGDRDRAKSIWTYLRLKNEFPQTFPEAVATKTTPPPTSQALRGTFIEVPMPANNPTVVHRLWLPPKKEFSKLPNTVPAGAEEAAEQSAVILQIIISERGTRGQVSADDAAGATAGDFTVAGNSFRAFKDTWDRPIGFVRWATNEGIGAPPFTRAGANVASPDPLDPGGRIKVANAVWMANVPRVANGLFNTPLNNPAALAQSQFGTPRNWLPTAISAGPNKKFDTFAAAYATPSTIPLPNHPPDPNNVGVLWVTDATDDLLGYQYRREN